MKRVYNIKTKSQNILHDFDPLNDNEIILNNLFFSQIEEFGYKKARTETLKEILNNSKDLDNSQLEELGNIKKNYFSALIEDSMLHKDQLDSLSNGLDLEKCKDHHLANLLEFLHPIIKKMPDLVFENLVNLSNTFSELVFFTLHPAFLLALGIKSFLITMPILFHKGNFSRLLLFTKHEETLSFSSLIQKFYSSFKQPIFKTFLASSIVVFVPIIGYSLMNYYSNNNSQVQLIEKYEQNKKDMQLVITLPESNRAGGQISNAVDCLSSAIKVVFAEFSCLLGAPFEAVLTETIIKISSLINVDIDSSSADSDEIEKISKDDKLNNPSKDNF